MYYFNDYMHLFNSHKTYNLIIYSNFEARKRKINRKVFKILSQIKYIVAA